ncbi:MAG: hypothetical protein CMH54_05590 [Myxococcales bacterium]|nr:hypothetical protein [Myxococcales bacterium]
MRTILGIIMVICLAASTSACGQSKCDKLKSQAKSAGCMDQAKVTAGGEALANKCMGIIQKAMEAKCK